jgi:hypothetical protein
MDIFWKEKAQENYIDLDTLSAEFRDNDHGHDNIENHCSQS